MTGTIDCRPLNARNPGLALLRRAGLFAGIAVVGLLALAGLGAVLGPPPPVKAVAPISVAPSAPNSPPAPNPPVASADPDVRADGGLDYLGMKAEAEEKLRAILTDNHGVQFRDVRTKLSTLDGGGIVAFCGEENSRTPLGGYGGFQRFIASRSVALTQAQASPLDFEQAWSQFCVNAVEGPQVWF